MSIPSAVFRLHLAREILDISSILDIKFSIYRLWEKTDIYGRSSYNCRIICNLGVGQTPSRLPGHDIPIKLLTISLKFAMFLTTVSFNSSIHQHLFPPRIITLEKRTTIGTIKLIHGAYKRNALNTHTKIFLSTQY